MSQTRINNLAGFDMPRMSYSPQLRIRQAPLFGFNILGFFAGNLGIGSAARSTVQILESMRIPYVIVPLSLDNTRNTHDITGLKYKADLTKPLPYAINLFHFNPHNLELEPHGCVCI